MTPARRNTLQAGIDLVQQVTRDDAWDTRAEATRNALRGMGAKIVDQQTNTYSIRLAGVTASCTHDKGEHLLVRWAANARRALAEGEV